MVLYTLNDASNDRGFWHGIHSGNYMDTSTITHTRPRCTHSGIKVNNGIGPAVCVCMRVTINAMPLSATGLQTVTP